MSETRTNFHTHTTRCHHASGRDEAYVKAAIKNGYSTLGFSDHACWKYDSGFIPFMRMMVSDFDGYKKSVRALQEKYKDQIRILLGMEAEYFPKYMHWLQDFCIQEGIDYLIFGNHYYNSDETGLYFGHTQMKNFDAYIDTCIAGMKTGMYSVLAHPELFLRSGGVEWNDTIEAGFARVLETAKEMDIPLEYNVLGMQANMAYGIEEYPHHRFWEMAAANGNKAIIGMDAHAPSDLNAKLFDKARDYLESLGMERVETIEPKDFSKIVLPELPEVSTVLQNKTA